MFTYTLDRIKLAALYMKRAQREDGLFDYEYDFVTGKYSEASNIVRQAGAGYALAQYYLGAKDIDIVDVVKDAIGGYARRSVAYGEGHLLSRTRKVDHARCGATALALLTELQYSLASQDDAFEDLREQWLKGLLQLHRPGQGFAQAPGNTDESPYFNGEAWLALAYYNAMVPDDARVGALLAGLDDYLMPRYADEFDIGFFHWGVLSAAQRYRATQEERFREYIAQQATYFAHEARPRVKTRVNTCYSVEGLGTAALVLANSTHHATLREDLIERIRREMTKNMTFQIMPDQLRMPLREGGFLYCKEYPQFAGAFINGQHRLQVRIDFTQHALSAMTLCRDLGLFK